MIWYVYVSESIEDNGMLIPKLLADLASNQVNLPADTMIYTFFDDNTKKFLVLTNNKIPNVTEKGTEELIPPLTEDQIRKLISKYIGGGG